MSITKVGYDINSPSLRHVAAFQTFISCRRLRFPGPSSSPARGARANGSRPPCLEVAEAGDCLLQQQVHMVGLWNIASAEQGMQWWSSLLELFVAEEVQYDR